ncbi:MAG: Holliday junction resolvase RuvX [Actinobacteria bacterium]|nr:Holliday junction resolvase RuvX [Actinomycetota bacterium]
MRIMALDIGEKNIGIAISDKTNILAIPYLVLKNDDTFTDKVCSIIKEKNINKIIAGMPYTLSGNMGQQANKTKEFINNLKEKINIEVDFIDERFSTKILKNNLIYKKKENKDKTDKYAAAIILENYLNKVKK